MLTVERSLSVGKVFWCLEYVSKEHAATDATGVGTHIFLKVCNDLLAMSIYPCKL